MIRFGRRAGATMLAVGLAAGAAGLAPASAQSAFAVTFTPANGPTGTVMQVTGSGCPAGGTVDVLLLEAGAASLPLGNGIVATGGTFDFNVTVQNDFMPQIPPGDYPMTFECIFNAASMAFDDGQIFTVTPPATQPTSTGALTASPANVAAGGSTTVTGPAPVQGILNDGTLDGYIPGQDVTLVLYPGAVALGTTVATAGTGGFSTPVTIPAGTAPGAYQVVAFGSYESVAPGFTAHSVGITVPAAPTTTTTTAPFVPPPVPPADAPIFTGLSPSTVAPGGLIEIDEGGFEPGEVVHIVLYSDPKVLATATANSAGVVKTEIRIPADTAVGSHTLVLFGSSTVKKAPLTIIQAAQAPGATLPRTGATPANGTIGLTGLVLVAAGAGTVLLSQRRLAPASRHRRR